MNIKKLGIAIATARRLGARLARRAGRLDAEHDARHHRHVAARLRAAHADVLVVRGIAHRRVRLDDLFAWCASANRAGAVADTKLVHNTRVEVIWTVLPVLILISMAVPATRTLVETEDATNTELTIRITGYQWKWGYEYVDRGRRRCSRRWIGPATRRASSAPASIPTTVPNYLLSVDHPLVVPAGVKVRLLITAQDVIHSWWVPALAIKKDAIPGFINEAWFKIDADKTGLYRGQCAELCGRDHGFMPIVIDVRSKADFDAWLKTQKALQRPARSGAGAARPRSGRNRRRYTAFKS